MNIALINASPKKAESASEALLHDLKALLNDGNTLMDFTFNKPSVTEEEIKGLRGCRAWIFSFPLYVDGIPSHLISCLRQLEQTRIGSEDTYVYGIANSGFYEGRQNRNALAILKNWCGKAGLAWGMGAGLGGGGALAFMKAVPLGKGPKSTLASAYLKLADAVNAHASADNIYTSVALPKALYKIAAEVGWNQLIKANGGKKRDLDRRL
ncbi:MAG TPA: hypothetical protein VN512_09525 [Clostridia bacterium]|nr:hypothetical protein [Clostridia bacterium]